MHNMYTSLKENIKKVFIGKDEIIDLGLACLFSNGHMLLDDVPGTGKTLLAKAFAASVNCSFKRIQFTPDLLPADLTGINFFNIKNSAFEFIPGPVFTNFLLADEINRATPKTQSGLLECMEERQVTVDGQKYELETPFMVLATQNPVEHFGTFPLPEAQLDRFMIKTKIGYTSHSATVRIISENDAKKEYIDIHPAAGKEDIKRISAAIAGVFVQEDIINYITNLIEATRSHRDVILGASVRAGIHLLKISKAFAFFDNRAYVLPDDVKRSAAPVLAHRLILSNTARTNNDEDIAIINRIMDVVPVPTEPSLYTRKA